MSVGRAVKKCVFRPCNIIRLIIIWSFLLYSASTPALPEYLPKAISPPSRFSCPARIVDMGKRFCVVQDGGKATDEYKKEASFAYVNLHISRALRNNSTIIELRDRMKRHMAWQIQVEKIPKRKGIYLTYRKTPRDQPRILHYFLNEKDRDTDRYVIMEQECVDPLLIELLNEKTYHDLRNNVMALFSPEGGCEEEIIHSIDSAEKTIDAAVYSFTDKNISDALKNAGWRGVLIRLFLNGKPGSNELARELESQNIKVKYYYKKGSLMHNKFMIVDEEKILSGSYNWTDQAEKPSRENLIILPYINDFQSEFEWLWGTGGTRSPPNATGPPLYKNTLQALFSPKGKCEDKITALIRLAAVQKRKSPKENKTIDIALYYFTNKDIAKALFDAKGSGVNIRILLDKGQKNRNDSIEKCFRKLQKNSKDNQGKLEIAYYRIPDRIMHNKFAVIGNFTITGSYNWTKSAENKNMENLIVIPHVVKDYLDEFNRLWEDSEKIVIAEGDSLRSSGLDPPAADYARAKGRWEKAVPGELSYDSLSYYKSWQNAQTAVFDPEDRSAYEIIGEIIQDSDKKYAIDKIELPLGINNPEDREELRKEIENFTDTVKILKIRKNLVVSRSFDSTARERRSLFEGRWFGETKYRGPPEKAQKDFNLPKEYNDAGKRGLVIIEPETILFYGWTKGGYAPQIFTLSKYLKNKKLHFCIDTIEEYK